MRAGEPRAGRRAGLVDRLRRGDDEGRIALLALGFVVVAASLVLVVTGAAGVHLDRKRLLALADLAALDAADALSASAYYAGGLPSDGLPLADAAVGAEVRDHVAAHPDPALGTVRVVSAGSPDGRSVVVRLAAVVPVPLVGGVLAPFTDGVPLTATATARAS
ncbi:pilus assembly protein TadG-related protein [Cellulomonas marina]|uniref:Putative Flp pilus-assembly TadG-like N-terminal domain-containing protein n=1 Tax=Cellulomonas marina TaxID=988821 RepID=A0A1I0V1N8_9CELL|nr:hypothetical protein [Cellulomonas marina]GIG28267.1 hypothetical protein Cma02nite_08670 [Cellulomonas marina]SFA70225.1 hypothetical protein SAMN05421867_10194 [Cellulomonas marina]